MIAPLSTVRWGASAALTAAEQTAYRQDIVEIALARASAAAKAAGVDAELWRAYQRGDLLEQRRPLMRDWAKFAMSKTVRNPA